MKLINVNFEVQIEVEDTIDTEVTDDQDEIIQKAMDLLKEDQAQFCTDIKAVPYVEPFKDD